MVRQLLPDGRAVWVVEGAVEELGPVYQLLEASGLSLSTPRRARPDYIGTDDAPVRTVRMVTVAAYLPIDSVEALAAARLKLDWVVGRWSCGGSARARAPRRASSKQETPEL